MPVYAGRNVKIKIDTAQVGGAGATWVTIGQQRGGSFERDSETVDATHKDTTGGWRSAVSTRIGWSVSCDGALNPSDTAWTQLLTRWGNQQTTWVQIDASAIAGGEKKEGTAWITSLSYEFPEADLVTYSVELAGDGALVTSP